MGLIQFRDNINKKKKRLKVFLRTYLNREHWGGKKKLSTLTVQDLPWASVTEEIVYLVSIQGTEELLTNNWQFL